MAAGFGAGGSGAGAGVVRAGADSIQQIDRGGSGGSVAEADRGRDGAVEVRGGAWVRGEFAGGVEDTRVVANAGIFEDEFSAIAHLSEAPPRAVFQRCGLRRIRAGSAVDGAFGDGSET